MSSAGPQLAVVLDVVASSRVGRLLRRRFTEVWRRSRRPYRPPAACDMGLTPPQPTLCDTGLRAACDVDQSPTESSAFLRRVQSAAAASTTRYQQQHPTNSVADPHPTVGVTTQFTSWRPSTGGPVTHTIGGPAPSTSTVTRTTGNAATSPSSLREQFTSFFQVSDNKLAMKLFGNKSALEKEKLRHKAVGHWVIHPCSDFRLIPPLTL